MTKERSEIPFASSFDELDPNDWNPTPHAPREKPPTQKSEIRKVANSSGFRSRQAPPDERLQRPRRIYRTGRSVQTNIKVRLEDQDKFLSICDANHWVQGQTFQYAIEALERELQEKKKAAGEMTKSA